MNEKMEEEKILPTFNASPLDNKNCSEAKKSSSDLHLADLSDSTESEPEKTSSRYVIIKFI